jgi:hypothetical protein
MYEQTFDTLVAGSWRYASWAWLMALLPFVGLCCWEVFVVLEELTVACDALGDAIDGTDPALLSGSHCAAAVEMLARTEKRCAGMRALLALRAVDCDAHKDRGFSNPATWIAGVSGVSDGEAKAVLGTAGRLESCPATREALLAGEVSLAQAAEIAKTEAAVAGSETAMLDLAGRAGMTALKDEGRRRRLEARDVDDAHRRQHRERYVRHWRDDDGMMHLTAAWPDDIGVSVINRIDAEVDRLLRQARHDNDSAEIDPPERLAADALAAIILGGSTGRPRQADLVLVCDIGAFQRGTAEPGEICHVTGGGPVPVSVAHEMATAAFIKAVLYRGKQIDTVAHFGRHLNAELRTALGLGDPPLFAGVACADCGRRYGLQWDHKNPVANHGPTSHDNLQALCWPCHADKTRRDRDAGLLTPHPPADTVGPDKSQAAAA